MNRETAVGRIAILSNLPARSALPAIYLMMGQPLSGETSRF